MKKVLIALISISLLSIVNYGFGFDTPTFYKTPHLFDPRQIPDDNWLANLDVQYSNGSTYRGRNKKSDKVNALNIYGYHNLLYLTSNTNTPAGASATVSANITNINTKRTNFAATNPAASNTFGQVEYHGKFEVDELMFLFRQNFVNKIFGEINLPIRRTRFSHVSYTDKSPEGTGNYTKNDTTWVQFLNGLSDIFRAYGLKPPSIDNRKFGFGDTTLLLGFHSEVPNLNEFTKYMKVIFKGGLLFPTGSKRNFNAALSTEHGYNTHFGFPVHLDVLFGLSNDVFFGTYSDLIFFVDQTLNNYQVKTDSNQNGFIKLHRAKVREEKGALFDFAGYLKLDRFFEGLSALAGYSFVTKFKDTLSVSSSTVNTGGEIVNSDGRLKNWRFHTLHLAIEYDLGMHEPFNSKKWQPHFEIFYDYPFSGRRVFMGSNIGGLIGCTFKWEF